MKEMLIYWELVIVENRKSRQLKNCRLSTYCVYVQTARLFGCCSATISGFFLYFVYGCIYCFARFFLCLFYRSICGFTSFFLYFISAISYCFFGATCVFIASSSSTAGSNSRDGHATTCSDQAGNAQAGKKLFHVSFFHIFPL
jgi:hypothetical protein